MCNPGITCQATTNDSFTSPAFYLGLKVASALVRQTTVLHSMLDHLVMFAPPSFQDILTGRTGMCLHFGLKEAGFLTCGAVALKHEVCAPCEGKAVQGSCSSTLEHQNKQDGCNMLVSTWEFEIVCSGTPLTPAAPSDNVEWPICLLAML